MLQVGTDNFHHIISQIIGQATMNRSNQIKWFGD